LIRGRASRRFILLTVALLAGLPALAGGEAPSPETRPAAESAPDSAPSCPPGVGPGGRTHLFLYLIDGLSTHALTDVGKQGMPARAIARLMDEGMSLVNNYSVSPWTVPAVTSLMTSLFPSAHGVLRAGDRLSPSARTLAEILKENGYETALFTSHPLIGARSGLDQGFDRIEEIPGPFGSTPRTGPGQTSAALNERILDWLDHRTSRAPTFIVAFSSDLQEPFGTPPPEGGGIVSKEDREWYGSIRRKLLTQRPGPLGLATEGDLTRMKVDRDRFARIHKDLHREAILFNDHQLDSLRRALESRLYWRDALFVVLSPHGEEMGERGVYGHGVFLYDSTLRVPVVMISPALFTRPGLFAKVNDTVDLMPSLLSILKLPIPEGIQGMERGMSPNPDSRRYPERPAYAESSPAGKLPTGRAFMEAHAGAKLIVYEDPPVGVKRPEMELFMMPDPSGLELSSVVAAEPRVAAQRRAILDEWREKSARPKFAADPPSTPPDPRLPEILRSLGYLQGPEPNLPPAASSGTAKRSSPHP
jgi:sulfatase-like protein